ncbi:MAG: hypothetical protein K2X01_00610 [Cyanobacteria bacterium]|nr:hypothetical protein [Cyanobacteriota bacterium]
MTRLTRTEKSATFTQAKYTHRGSPQTLTPFAGCHQSVLFGNELKPPRIGPITWWLGAVGVMISGLIVNGLLSGKNAGTVSQMQQLSTAAAVLQQNLNQTEKLPGDLKEPFQQASLFAYIASMHAGIASHSNQADIYKPLMSQLTPEDRTATLALIKTLNQTDSRGFQAEKAVFHQWADTVLSKHIEPEKLKSTKQWADQYFQDLERTMLTSTFTGLPILIGVLLAAVVMNQKGNKAAQQLEAYRSAQKAGKTQ